MLEWYRVGWDHHRLMQETAELVGQALAWSDAVRRCAC
jgi:lysyl-tRNA synthetase class 2